MTSENEDIGLDENYLALEQNVRMAQDGKKRARAISLLYYVTRPAQQTLSRAEAVIPGTESLIENWGDIQIYTRKNTRGAGRLIYRLKDDVAELIGDTNDYSLFQAKFASNYGVSS